MKKTLATLLLALGFAAGITGSIALAATATFRVVETPTYHLYSGESAAATTVRITPYPTDLDGVKLTMTDFGTTPTVTMDPGFKGIEEIESFTGITDNGDNTATLTGLSRDLQSKYPYTGTGTGRTHGSGSIVVFGNNPQLYGRLAAPENTQTWTATQTYASTTFPGFDIDPGSSYYTGGPNTTFVDYAQLTRTALAGTVNASTIAQGVSQIATPIQAASSTVFGSTGAYLALTSSIATSTCQVATSSVLTLQSNGHVYGPCLDQTYPYTFSGNNNYTGTSTFNKAIIGDVVTLVANSGATTTVDWSQGNTFVIYLVGNQSLVFTNVPANNFTEGIKILVFQDGTGSRLLTNIANTSTTTVKWASGFAPTLSTSGNVMDTLSFFTGTSTSIVYGGVTNNFH